MTETTVDGIPTLFARREDGQYAGGIVFRVGWADETLAVRGLTHLVEHLALHGVAARDVHHNGETHALHTHLYASGTAEQVVRVLNGVCAALCDLPVDRLETEKEVLRAEARGRGGAGSSMAGMRHGARGHGLSSYAELGLANVDAGLTVMWANEAFSRDNAVLWLSGESMPEGLSLTLPEGERQSLPPVTDVLGPTPAYYLDGSEDVVHVTAVVPRSCRAMLFTELLSRALFADLRQRDGLGYSASATYRVRDAEHAVVAVVADCLPERRGAAVGAVVDTLARLRWGSVPADELEEVRAAALAAVATSRTLPHTGLPARALEMLLGREPDDPAVLEDELRAVTADDVRAAAEDFHATALAQVPELGLEWAGWAAAPVSSDTAVDGTGYASLAADGPTLVVGDDGLTLRSDRGRSTVHFDRVAAMLAYADGGRSLLGEDGFHVAVEPTLLALDEDVVARIDAAVDPARVVRRPAREAASLPRPAGHSPEAAGPPAGQGAGEPLAPSSPLLRRLWRAARGR
ncbi:insulinase family protein [Phycicoccus flavus]|uniref:Insulinase family protein n=1 Tax=Phycicoccus flavus TaxID=2502783 RepID=A0A8T6R5Z7_9MICO|nr:insulinase family protein [Phycicoccus flavus]NHA69182.1 insulinase family protein [Phycicoccus flavus]